jgi:predicted transcriptional regulator of viral defense system
MKQTKQARVLELHAKGLKPKDIATKSKCNIGYVYKIVSDNKIKQRDTKADAQYKVFMSTSKKPVVDNVNHPSHYKTGGIETIDFIEAKKLDYHLGNVVKYITRADLKGNKLEDLQKAQWYLNRAINNLTK